jgi:hypothetical protein
MNIKVKNKEYKLYRVIVSYFRENTEDFSQSIVGQDYMFISADSDKVAKKIALKDFKKAHDKYGYNKISLEAFVMQLPEFVSLTGNGNINFRYT